MVLWIWIEVSMLEAQASVTSSWLVAWHKVIMRFWQRSHHLKGTLPSHQWGRLLNGNILHPVLLSLGKHLLASSWSYLRLLEHQGRLRVIYSYILRKVGDRIVRLPQSIGAISEGRGNHVWSSRISGRLLLHHKHFKWSDVGVWFLHCWFVELLAVASGEILRLMGVRWIFFIFLWRVLHKNQVGDFRFIFQIKIDTFNSNYLR